MERDWECLLKRHLISRKLLWPILWKILCLNKTPHNDIQIYFCIRQATRSPIAYTWYHRFINPLLLPCLCSESIYTAIGISNIIYISSLLIKSVCTTKLNAMIYKKEETININKEINTTKQKWYPSLQICIKWQMTHFKMIQKEANIHIKL